MLIVNCKIGVLFRIIEMGLYLKHSASLKVLKYGTGLSKLATDLF